MTASLEDDARFPLGVPVNRPLMPAPRPVPNRPHWFYGPDGAEYYVEPPRPKADTPGC